MVSTISSGVVPAPMRDGYRIMRRNTKRFFVGETPLGAQPVLTVEVAVIAHDDDDRLVELIRFFQCVQEPAEAVVHCHQHLQPLPNGAVTRDGVRTQRWQRTNRALQRRLTGGWHAVARETRDRVVRVEPFVGAGRG